MALNLNRFPHFDDAETALKKGYHRILFKPGYAVQARELTQLQTILQAQIERFGNNVFKEGSVVTGCAESFNFAFPYVKILDLPSGETTGWTDTALADLVGKELRGVTSRARGVVKYVQTGSEIDGINLKTLYIHYTSSGGAGTGSLVTGTQSTFLAGETLEFVDAGGSGPVVASVANAVGKGSIFTVDDGIVYAMGSFVLHNKQTIILDKYSTLPSAKVGFEIAESVVTYQGDSTLLDPAQGSFNYTAPGADRYKLATEIVSYPLESLTPQDFFLLFEVEDGLIRRKFNKTQYAEIRKEMARRTYDESGNYTVRPFGIVIREHLKNGNNGGKYEAGDATKLAIGIEPGKAYVQGYEHETYITETVAVDKGTDVRTIQNRPISTAYGSYVRINEVAGPWNLNTGAIINLTNVAQGVVTAGTYSNNAAPSGPQMIGTARVRMVLHESGTIGTASAVYQLYLYDIKMNAGYSFWDVLGVYANVNSVKSFGALVSAGVLQDSNAETSLFPIPYTAVKTLKPTGTYDTTFQYRKEVVAECSGNTFTISVDPTEQFAFSSISSAILNANVYATLDEDIGATLKKGQVLDFTASGRTAIFDAGTLKLTLEGAVSVGDSAGKLLRVAVNVVRVNAGPKTKSLLTSRYVKVDTTTHSAGSLGPWTLGVSDVVGIETVWLAAGGDVTSGAFAALAAEPTGWSDVTSEFIWDGGQRDSLYGHGTFRLRPGSTLSTSNVRILVKFRYYSHSTSANTVGYFSVDSYPVNDSSPSASQIYTYQIPRYTAKTGIVYDLRNTLDFRPRVQDTAATATVATASVNPALSTTVSSAGVLDPVPTEEFITDLEYYLGRMDRIVLSETGRFSAVRGVSREVPTPPLDVPNAMTIGLVTIPPYPSLAPTVARNVGRPDEAATFKINDNRRYTMRDIGSIEKRLDRMEYYTSLSLLEQETANLLVESGVTPGLNRFKNGFLVDSFKGHNVGNVYDPAYKVSIDPTAGELRPYFSIDNIDLELWDATNLVRRAQDVIITVTTAMGRPGESVVSTSGSVAAGIVRHAVGTKLYLEKVTGVFEASQTITVGGVANSVVGAPIVAPDGDLLMLPYEHVVYGMNPFASKPRNCVGALLFDYNGAVTLDPPQDLWADTTRAADVHMNFDGVSDNWENRNDAWSTEWGDWETMWTGIDVETEILWRTETQQRERQRARPRPRPIDDRRITEFEDRADIDQWQWDMEWETVDVQVPVTQSTTTQTMGQQRTGVQRQIRPETITRQMGNRIIDVSLVPFMRSTIVTFSATRLKPLTRMYVFFDGEDVTDHCRPVKDQTGADIVNRAYGAPLITDATGNLLGEFRIPAGRFRVGTKAFVLVDDSENRRGFVTSSATSMFTASGLATVEENTIVSTRIPTITTREIVETRETVISRDVTVTEPVVDTPVVDPIAQTFFVAGKPAGMFLTKVDIFFRKKSATAPVMLQIREVVNGYPSGRILPFGEATLTPDQVNADETAKAATPFTFPAPVYLKNDSEYCLVVMPAGNSDEYEVWVSELGENQLGTTTRITEQPAAGVLFISANNSTWTALQSEDMKFTMYAAQFDTAVTGVANLNNTGTDFLEVTMTGGSPDFVPGDVIASTTPDQRGRIKYVTRYGDTIIVHVDKTVATDIPFVGGEAITATSYVEGAAPKVKTATVVGRDMRKFNVITPNVGHLMFTGSDITWTYVPTSSGGADLPEDRILMNQTTTTPFEFAVFSDSEHQDSLSFNATVSTTDANVSPIIDLKKMAAIIVSNEINNDDTEETNPESGAALSRYISRRVVLEEGMDAEDIRVYLTQSTPAGSKVKVYAKLQNASDSTSFTAMPWIELAASSAGSDAFAEVMYELPAGVTTAGVYTYSGYSGYKTFAIKIVLLSNNTSVIPKVRDMRAIALMT